MPMCQELVTGGALQGMGKTLSCSVITIILTAARIPLALLLGRTGLGLDDGLEIMECSGLRLSKEGRLIEAETLGDGGGRIVLSVRSGGFAYE